MTTYEIRDGDGLDWIGEAQAATPSAAAKIVLLAANKERYEATAEHGPNWGRAAPRSSGNGNGAQDMSHCVTAYLDGARIAVIEIRKIRPEADFYPL